MVPQHAYHSVVIVNMVCASSNSLAILQLRISQTTKDRMLTLVNPAANETTLFAKILKLHLRKELLANCL